MASRTAAIASVNLAEDATISASSGEVLAPASNLLQPDTRKQWIGVGATTDSILIAFAAPPSFDTLALINVTGTTARVRFSSADTSGLAGDVLDSGSLTIDQDYRDLIVLRPALVTTAKYLLIDLVHTSPVAAGGLFVGARTHFAINIAYGWQRLRVDPSKRAKTEGGQTQVFEKPGYWTMDVAFESLTVAERNGVVERIDRDCGLHKPILFIADPDSTNLARDSIYGLVSDMTSVVQPYFDTFTKQYKIDQRL